MKDVDRRILWAFGLILAIGTVVAFIYSFQQLTLSDRENRAFVLLGSALIIPMWVLAAVIDRQSHPGPLPRSIVASWIGIAVSTIALLIIELLDTSRTATTAEGLLRVLAVGPAVVLVLIRIILQRRAR